MEEEKNDMLTYEQEIDISAKLGERLIARGHYDANATLEEMSPADQEIVREGDRAASLLVEYYLPFIRNTAHTVFRGRDLRRTGYVEADDLINTGVAAAMVCTNRFDARRGRRFSTYAGQHIMNSMLMSIDKVSTPLFAATDLIQKSNKWYAIRGDLTTQLGREPTEEEMAEALPNINFTQVADIPKRAMFADVDSPDFQETPSEVEFESAFDLDYHTARLRQALVETEVNDRFAEAILMYFGCDRGYPRDISEFSEVMEVGPRIARDWIDSIQNFMIHPHNRVILHRLLSQETVA